MKNIMILLSTSVFLFIIPIAEEGVDLVSEASTNITERKESEEENTIKPTDVWLPGDLEDEELP